LKSEPPVLSFDGNCLICGDLHGDFDTLCEVIDMFISSNNQGLIFQGHYDDIG
jgi:hypothetical protein